ncbi:MAG: cupin domain-containing protein [Cyanobacteria bacterium P01_A01_bin.135]
MSNGSDSAAAPKFSYWHVWTDNEGVSHQTQCELTNFERESMGGDAAPQWNNRLLTAESKIIFAQLPVGWVGEWHENPQPQWIIPLSGTWFVETMDGQRVEMGPGEISFGGDQNTQPNAQGRQGHLSGTVGDEPVKMMIVQLEGDRWVGLKPGDLA